MTATCACSKALGPKNRTGRCRSCSAAHLNSDPAIIARRAEARAAYFDRPGVREAQAERMRRWTTNMPAAERERRRQVGIVLAREVLARPEVRARAASPEVRERAGKARTNTTLAWCPPELRDAYRELIRQHHYRAAAARLIIEAEIPGTAEHGKREVARNQLKMRMKHEREQREAY